MQSSARVVASGPSRFLGGSGGMPPGNRGQDAGGPNERPLRTLVGRSRLRVLRVRYLCGAAATGALARVSDGGGDRG